MVGGHFGRVHIIIIPHVLESPENGEDGEESRSSVPVPSLGGWTFSAESMTCYEAVNEGRVNMNMFRAQVERGPVHREARSENVLVRNAGNAQSIEKRGSQRGGVCDSLPSQDAYCQPPVGGGDEGDQWVDAQGSGCRGMRVIYGGMKMDTIRNWGRQLEDYNDAGASKVGRVSTSEGGPECPQQQQQQQLPLSPRDDQEHHPLSPRDDQERHPLSPLDDYDTFSETSPTDLLDDTRGTTCKEEEKKEKEKEDEKVKEEEKEKEDGKVKEEDCEEDGDLAALEVPLHLLRQGQDEEAGYRHLVVQRQELQDPGGWRCLHLHHHRRSFHQVCREEAEGDEGGLSAALVILVTSPQLA